jgi:hypothetical protein
MKKFTSLLIALCLPLGLLANELEFSPLFPTPDKKRIVEEKKDDYSEQIKDMMLEDFDKDSAIENLEKKRKIVIDKEDPYFDEVMVKFIYQYAESADLQGPMNMFQGNINGPKLVWSENNQRDIYFSPEASKKLLLQQIHGLRKSVLNSQRFVDEINLQFDYSNTLAHQLNNELLSQEKMVQMFESELPFEVAMDDNGFKHRPFSKNEMGMLLKSFQDLPPKIVHQLELAKIKVVRKGVLLPDNASASYDPGTKTILMSDEAFRKDQDTQGEGVFFHEVGHAAWFGLKESIQELYASISWNRDIEGVYTAKSNHSNFVTSYASETVEEDFAEHFSSYLFHPENLKKKAPNKYEFFKLLFGDTEYKTDAHQRAKIEIDSEDPDIIPPEISVPFKDLVKFSLKTNLEYTSSNIAKSSYVIHGIKDHHSGIRKISFRIEDENRTSWEENVDVSKGNNGCYQHIGSYMNLNEYEMNAILKITEMTIMDNADNVTRVPDHELPKIILPGLKKNLSRIKRPDQHPLEDNEELQKLIQIKELPPLENGNIVHRILLPLKKSDVVGTVCSYWSSKLKESHFSTCSDNEEDNHQFVTIDGISYMQVDTFLPPETMVGEQKMSSLYFYYEETDKYKRETYSIGIKGNLKNTIVNIPVQKQTDFDHPQIDIQQLSLRAKTIQSPKGETSQQIEVNVPVKGINKGKPEAVIIFKSSDGKELTREFNPEDLVKNVNRDGVETYSANFSLPKNHAGGEYILQSVEFFENYKGKYKKGDVGKASIPNDLVRSYFSKSDVVVTAERGIIKTVKLDFSSEYKEDRPTSTFNTLPGMNVEETVHDQMKNPFKE